MRIAETGYRKGPDGRLFLYLRDVLRRFGTSHFLFCRLRGLDALRRIKTRSAIPTLRSWPKGSWPKGNPKSLVYYVRLIKVSRLKRRSESSG